MAHADHPDPASILEVLGDTYRSRVGTVTFELRGESGGWEENVQV